MSTPNRPTALRVLQSASAATLSQVWRLAVTFGTMLVIRRLLGPDELAVWLWAEPVFVLLSIVRDLGINGHLIRLDRRLWGNFAVVVVVWGGAFAVAVALGAPWLAQLWESHDQQTVEIIRVLAAFLWIQGIGLVPLTFFEAEHLLTRAIPAELARNTTFAALALLWVSQDWGVWGVIWAHLAGSAVFAVMLWWSSRRIMPLEVDLAEIPELVRGSLPLAALSLLEQAVLFLDVLLLGMVMQKEAVGEVALATYALFFFSRLVADAVGRAVYPAIVAYRDDPARAFGMYRMATLVLVCFVVPLAFVMHHNAELIALLLGGEKWTGAAGYLAVAAFIPFLRPLTMFGREYLLMAHKDRLLIAYTLGNLVALGGLGLLLVKGTDLEELGMAIAGYFPLGTLFLGYGLWQLAPTSFVKLVREIGSLYVLGLAAFAAIWLIPRDATVMLFAGSALASLVFLVLAYWRHGKEAREFLAQT